MERVTGIVPLHGDGVRREAWGAKCKAYLRWIDATTSRPDLRAARIAEVVDLLAAGLKERPR